MGPKCFTLKTLADLYSKHCVFIDNIKPKLAQESDNEMKASKKLMIVSNYENYCYRNNILCKFIDSKELLVDLNR